MFSNFLLELYWIKSLDHKSLVIACGYFSDRHEYLVILFKKFFCPYDETQTMQYYSKQ